MSNVPKPEIIKIANTLLKNNNNDDAEQKEDEINLMTGNYDVPEYPLHIKEQIVYTHQINLVRNLLDDAMMQGKKAGLLKFY